jgi:glucose-6-phosphate 1-dehydrogenase
MPPEPFSLVIFGATGDLTHRKLIPALFGLFSQNLLPQDFNIIAFARRPFSNDDFRNQLRSGVVSKTETAPAGWDEFAGHILYHQGDFDNPQSFQGLKNLLANESAERKTRPNILFYCATTPEYFPIIVEQIDRAGLAGRGNDLTSDGAAGYGWTRIVVEKPFGRDLASAQQLNRQLRSAFSENQIFRIDHYLGKETVQNLLVFRFANRIFEPLWNNRYIDHVQITVAESAGIGDRGGYYDHAGAIRDIIQNHMMHLLALVAMEAPTSLQADDVRHEKVKVLRALRPIPAPCAANDMIRGQYAAGTYHGQTVKGYLEELRIRPDSTTETFTAMRTYIDNWRWAGVPFYLRTGKRMPARITDIGVQFKAVPQVLFNSGAFGEMAPNVLAIRIQPDEGIMLQFQVKAPGPGMRIEPLKMQFGYAETFRHSPPEAYQRLLLDAIQGDSTLFTRDDEVEAAWAFLAPVIEGCCTPGNGPVYSYPGGSWGPKEADRLIEEDGRKWDILRKD